MVKRKRAVLHDVIQYCPFFTYSKNFQKNATLNSINKDGVKMKENELILFQLAFLLAQG